MANFLKIIKNGIIDENPVLIQVIGMCATMAVTTNAANGVAMGAATTAVLVCSNFLVSLLKNFIPDTVRIPCFIVITAAFTTAVEMVLKAYFPSLNASLGIYIPLITVNCIILSRSESYACKNSVMDSIADGIGMGLGFTIVLVLTGIFREFFGSGAVFGYEIAFMPKTIIMILPPGGFFTLAFLIAGLNYVRGRKSE